MLKHRQSSRAWRADIEGLRAFAIIPVLLYHFDPAIIPGGFLGVDLFFVISGYLITKILFNKPDYLKSLSGVGAFLKRRFLRIFPTLIVWFVIFSAIFSAFVSKAMYSSIYLTPIYSFLGVSNFYLAFKNVDYFSPESGLNPFLHSWSVSVEDQFYILFIVLLGVLYKLNRIVGKNRSKEVIFLLTVFFIAVGLISGPAGSDIGFFMPYDRLFEFLIGSSCYLLFGQSIQRQLFLGILKIISLSTLLFLFIWLNDKSINNAYYLLVCLLSSFLLVDDRPQFSLVSNLLSTSILRYIGRLSFSLYVVHYPVLKLMEYYFDLSMTSYYSLAIYLLVIWILSIVNYTYIERRFIQKYTISSEFVHNLKLVRLVASVAMAVTLVFTFRLGMPIYSISSGINTRLEHASVKSYIEKGEKKVIVLGDSHAQQLFPAFKKIAKEEHMSFVDETGSACFLSEDLSYIAHNGKWINRCHDHIKKVLNQLAHSDSNNRVIFMGMRSLAYLSSNLISKADSPVKGMLQENGVFIANHDNELIDSFMMSFEKTLKKLSVNNSHIVFLYPLPEMYIPTSHCIYNPNKISCRVNRSQNEEMRAYFVKRMDDLKNKYSNLHTLDLFYDVCPSKYCLNVRGDKIVFRDDDHLSKEMVVSLVPKITKQLNIAFNKANHSCL